MLLLLAHAAAKGPDEEAQEAPIKLVCRSLQVLCLELRSTRCADVLESNNQLW